jgi:DNA-binding transcriptional MerR regulator
MNIREFAAHTGLTAHTLRYYERVGLMGQVGRDDNGHRVYGAQDSQWVSFLHHLRETGMPIREMQRYCALRAQGDTTLPGRLALLERHTEQLSTRLREQHDHLARLRETVAVYQSRLRAHPGARKEPTGAPPPAADPAPIVDRDHRLLAHRGLGLVGELDSRRRPSSAGRWRRRRRDRLRRAHAQLRAGREQHALLLVAVADVAPGLVDHSAGRARRPARPARSSGCSRGRGGRARGR